MNTGETINRPGKPRFIWLYPGRSAGSADALAGLQGAGVRRHYPGRNGWPHWAVVRTDFDTTVLTSQQG
jgi:hypothetical protein